LRDRVVSAFAAASSALRCDANCCCCCAFEAALLVSAGMLLSTSAPKLSLGSDGSGRAGFGGAV
jgi:hypothetical protein